MAEAAPAAAAKKPLVANVYIDGFNLYRGCLEDSAYKWLDLGALAAKLATGHQIRRVRYFTAHVDEPGANDRQLVYLRALRTLQHMFVHATGTFTTHTVIRPLADDPAKDMASVLEWNRGGEWVPLRRPAPGYWVRASVRHKTEKGSDVNLATYLIFDACHKEFDAAWVVSGDSDLETPVRLVRTEFGRAIHVVNPTSNKPSAELQAAATSYATLSVALLGSCQLPDPVVDAAGKEIRKPPSW